MRQEFLQAPLQAGIRRNWRRGWPNTVILDGASWNKDHVHALAAAHGLPVEVESWLAKHGKDPPRHVM
jgi:hypothetical protein